MTAVDEDAHADLRQVFESGVSLSHLSGLTHGRRARRSTHSDQVLFGRFLDRVSVEEGDPEAVAGWGLL